MKKRFLLRCPFPGCSEILGEAYAEQRHEAYLNQHHICTNPCAKKKHLIERSADGKKPRDQVKVDIKAMPDFAERPTPEEVDFVFDNYLKR